MYVFSVLFTVMCVMWIFVTTKGKKYIIYYNNVCQTTYCERLLVF